MARKPTRSAPKRRLVYEGPAGFCPDCGKVTEVRLGSTLGEPSAASWTVPTPTLAHVYREVAKRVKTDQRTGKLYVTDPSEYDSTRRAKLFFVDGDSAIAGPFGQNGLKVFLGSSFGPDHVENVRVLVVATTHRALKLIRESPYARPPAGGLDNDGSADLF